MTEDTPGASWLPDFSDDALVTYHAVMMSIWALLAIPTVLIWKQSILWIAFMSLYANFVGHFSAFDAARAAGEAAAQRNEH